MAKQTELKHLLQELEIATRTHARAMRFPLSHDERARAFHAADVAEKRVLSFFDKLSTELEDSARAYKSLQDQRNYLAQERDEARKAAAEWQNAAQKAKADLQELAQQVMAMKEVPRDPVQLPTDAPQMGEPFNSTRAAAGEPIEVLMSPGLWIEKQYIGTFSEARGEMVTYVHNDAPDCAPLASVRMKSKAPQQLQMFANVFRGALDERLTGALFDTALDAENLAHNRIKHKLIAAAVPVTITVAG